MAATSWQRLDRAEQTVLHLAAEESLLVEVPEEVAPADGPAVVDRLLRAGLVGILDVRTEADLTDADLTALRADPPAWRPGPKGRHNLAVFLTDAGWDVYDAAPKRG